MICHRLIGYPRDFEFIKSWKSESTMKGNVIIQKEDVEDVIDQYGDTGNVKLCSVPQQKTILKLDATSEKGYAHQPSKHIRITH